MAMNVGPAENGEDEAISTINTTPLVDVMLVLLIIFLVTIPVITQSIPLKLPEETNVPRQTKPENIEIAVTKDGDVYWGLQPVRDNDDLVDAPEEGRGAAASARGAHPRRSGRPLRVRRPGRFCLPARGHPEDRVRHRAPATRRLSVAAKESCNGNECRNRGQLAGS